MNKISFESDDEKMIDFFNLDKDDFLESYSYLTEEEYEATKEYINNHYGEYREKLVNGAIESLKGSMEYNGIPYDELKENADKLSLVELLESVAEQ